MEDSSQTDALSDPSPSENKAPLILGILAILAAIVGLVFGWRGSSKGDQALQRVNAAQNSPALDPNIKQDVESLRQLIEQRNAEVARANEELTRLRADLARQEASNARKFSAQNDFNNRVIAAVNGGRGGVRPAATPSPRSGGRAVAGGTGGTTPVVVGSGVSTRPPNLASNPAASPATGAATTAGGYRKHTVSDGQTFGSIAKHYGVRVSEIQSANPGVDSRKLKIGQQINIPADAGAAPGPRPAPRATATTAPAAR